ncbi:DUF6012 family protein [Vibrio mediterranei]|uniref:Uncharacterized protein n=1 Tax=Vibrio mediterranei TaxID=689 RepID=A0ABX5DD30_9VIBR|nr:DUF6012 family protein [Vibrio mediterranei]PRQ66526.1 hypothetical protein COR51_16465 [Vibrio mediterranei]
MLIHLIPKIYNRFSDIQLNVIDVCIPELKVVLQGDKDLMVGRPYLNKNYHVICRKVGKKKMNGFFLETEKALQKFTVLTRWEVDNLKLVHRVHYTVLDSNFDAVSDDHSLITTFDDAPVKTQPKMEVIFPYESRSTITATDKFSLYMMVDRVVEVA